MALDKLVDSTQLDSDLTSVANAIRTKGGTSAQLAFPADFVQAIGDIPSGGGDPYEKARQIAERTITEYIDDSTTQLGHSAFRNCTSLVTLQVHSAKKVLQSCIENTKITALALPKINTAPSTSYGTCSTLRVLDYGPSLTQIGSNSLPFANLQTLILRRSSGLVAGATTSFNTTPMKSGGTGVTVYIPKVLYDHLGDGTSLDYQNASVWSTYYGYGTITWAKIEGSIYETQYGDGTTIPTT